MELTMAQKRALYHDGLVKLPGIVPEETVNAALWAINSSLGSLGIHPERLPAYRTRSYCPELQSSSWITDVLTTTPLWELAESAVGRGKLKPVPSGQIALRFPSMDPPRDPTPHLDGVTMSTNGTSPGTIDNFTALIGVFLNDIPGPYSGNFTVWRGTHHTYQEYFRQKGPDSLLHGMPDVELPESEQVTARAGDAILVHYQLGHGIASNASPNIRYALFFRLQHVDHDELHWECMTDIWREWDGMREIAYEAVPS